MAEAKDYYARTCGGLHDFRDFDDEVVCWDYCKRARRADSRNFVLDFSAEQAWCAFDQPVETLAALLESPRPASLESRWINIWAPDEQRDAILALAHHFDFSPRLTGLMCSSASRRRAHGEPRTAAHARSWPMHLTRANKSVRSFTTSKSAPAAFTTVLADVELARHAAKRTPAASILPEVVLLQKLGHYDVVDSLWHWSSVDLGRRYVCLGYNSLYNIDPSVPRSSDARDQDRPNGTRVWSWLVLCDDKTVVSIYEPIAAELAQSMHNDAGSTRYNLLNVFAQLSHSTDLDARNPISLVPLRFSFNHDLGDASTEPIDGPGLLFYYLFDDWHTTYSLVARRGHQYSAELNRLRESMMTRANLSHVTRLHHIGRQLAVLKRLYESYSLILTRLLEKQRAPPGSAADSNHSCPSALHRDDTSTKTPAADELGVFLTSAARVRFERLGDRIQLYALSEIQECVDLKESLLSMNFNLITIRESDAVERLTRITILLAKVTILFLPVSLMTAYFSTQLVDAGSEFTIRSYWISFAVIMVLSFGGLFLFGKISGTVEGELVYKPLNTVMWELGAAVLGGRWGAQPAREQQQMLGLADSGDDTGGGDGRFDDPAQRQWWWPGGGVARSDAPAQRQWWWPVERLVRRRRRQHRGDPGGGAGTGIANEPGIETNDMAVKQQ